MPGAIRVIDKLSELSEYTASENIIVQIDDVLDLVVPGYSLVNSTEADVDAQRQDSPGLLFEASAWDIGEGAAKPQLGYIYLNGNDGDQAFLNIAFGSDIENLSSTFSFGKDGTFYTDNMFVGGTLEAAELSFGNDISFTRDGAEGVVVNAGQPTDTVWIKFNGVTAGHPGIKRSNAELHFKKADDSAFCDVRFNIVRAGEWLGTAIADAYIASAATWNAKQNALGFTPENSANKDQAGGYAGLDLSGRLNPAQLPNLAITDTFVVVSQAAMLALTAQTGDVAVRTDENKSYILAGADPTVLADWQELLTPTTGVTTVFGRSGAVTAQNNDYTWAQIDKTTSSLADLTTRSAADLTSGTLPDGRFPATLPAVSGVNLTGLTKSQVGLSNVENTALSTWAGSVNITTVGAVTATSYTGPSLTAANGTGSNGNGTDLTISGGRPTGSGIPGNVVVAFGDQGAAPTTLNAFSSSLYLVRESASAISVTYRLETSTTADQEAVKLQAIWTNAGHATRTADFVVHAVNSGTLAERFRVKASGIVLTTAAIQAQAGAVGTPSYSFVAETNTGLFLNGGAAFATSGTERARFQNNGNVGLIVNGGVGFCTSYPTTTTAIKQNAAAVLEVNNGTPGQWGGLLVGTRDAGTTTVTNGLTVGHQSTGTPAAGLGSAILLNINSSTTADQNAAQIAAVWTTATHASRSAELQINVVQNAGALATVAKFDKTPTAGETGLWIWDADNGNLERVTVGAADSGGAGFKLLRIAN